MKGNPKRSTPRGDAADAKRPPLQRLHKKKKKKKEKNDASRDRALQQRRRVGPLAISKMK